CHDFDSMNPADQKKRSRKQHANAMEDGNTCIDCHKGIAHNKVHDKLTEQELEEISKPVPENKRPIAPQWQAFIDNGKKLVTNKADKKANAPAAEQALAAPTAAEQAPAANDVSDAAPAAAAAKPAATAASGSSIDWSGVEPAEVTLFYPGQASIEWIMTGSDHGGKRPFLKGDRCFDCHEDEEVDIGDLIVTGDKVEPTPIPGKRGSIVVNIQAAHDADNLYMRFQWEDGEHAPIPFADGGKMDPENPVKLAIMLATDSEDDPKVEFAERAGCWQTCHHDVNYMPDQPDKSALAGSKLDSNNGFTKYLKESRTDIEIEGKGGAKRGGWDKLKDAAEIQAALENGSFMDLLRYKAGTGESEDGYILAERVMSGGQGVDFTGSLNDGIWTVEMTRKLTSDKPGDISMATDQMYNIGFAIHDDYSNSRFHHVSLGLKLGFDNEEDADINAIGK
ncbi:MAG: ethylbenzene dehydrogenase-related protein, partial [Gammaproteobacteria bacterium]|nr:ethylbenzene dehydrogenase-related protein [Gammaproteobacteria bacterium]